MEWRRWTRILWALVFEYDSEWLAPFGRRVRLRLLLGWSRLQFLDSPLSFVEILDLMIVVLVVSQVNVCKNRCPDLYAIHIVDDLSRIVSGFPALECIVLNHVSIMSAYLLDRQVGVPSMVPSCRSAQMHEKGR